MKLYIYLGSPAVLSPPACNFLRDHLYNNHIRLCSYYIYSFRRPLASTLSQLFLSIMCIDNMMMCAYNNIVVYLSIHALCIFLVQNKSFILLRTYINSDYQDTITLLILLFCIKFYTLAKKATKCTCTHTASFKESPCYADVIEGKDSNNCDSIESTRAS